MCSCRGRQGPSSGARVPAVKFPISAGLLQVMAPHGDPETRRQRCPCGPLSQVPPPNPCLIGACAWLCTASLLPQATAAVRLPCGLSSTPQPGPFKDHRPCYPSLTLVPSGALHRSRHKSEPSFQTRRPGLVWRLHSLHRASARVRHPSASHNSLVSCHGSSCRHEPAHHLHGAPSLPPGGNLHLSVGFIQPHSPRPSDWELRMVKAPTFYYPFTPVSQQVSVNVLNYSFKVFQA